MNFRKLLQCAILIILAGWTSPGWAEPSGREAGPSSTPPAMQELDRLEQQGQPGEQHDGGRHFEAKRRERMIQMLQLDEATRGKLLQRLEQLDQKGEGLRRQRREAFLALREQAKSARSGLRKGDRKPQDTERPAAGTVPVDDAALKAALDRVYAVEEAVAGLRRERLQIARDLLTPEQQMRFLMYSIKFQKEMRERLEREHSAMQGRKGQPGEPEAR